MPLVPCSGIVVCLFKEGHSKKLDGSKYSMSMSVNDETFYIVVNSDGEKIRLYYGGRESYPSSHGTDLCPCAYRFRSSVQTSI